MKNKEKTFYFQKKNIGNDTKSYETLSFTGAIKSQMMYSNDI